MLVAAVALAAFLAFSSVVDADVVKLDDGRILRGEVIDKGDKIEVRGRLGSITVEKSKVIEILKEEDASAREDSTGAQPVAKEAETYKSSVLGFSLEVPKGGWILKRCPPEPLCDVAVYNPRWNGKVHLMLQPETRGKPEFTESGADAYSETLVRHLSIYFENLKAEAAAVVTYQDAPALRVRLRGTRKGFIKEYVELLVFQTFQRRDLIFTVRAAGPAKRAADIEKVLDSILASLKFFEPREYDGNTYTSFKYCFGLTKPADWEFKTDADYAVAAVSSDGKMTFTVSVIEGDLSRQEIARIGKTMQEEIKKNRPDAEFDVSRMSTIKGTICWELAYRSAGLLWREHFFFVGERLIRTTFSCPVKAGNTQPVFDALMAGLEVYRDMLSKGSLESNIRALELAYEADKAGFGDRVEESLALYDAAIAAFPTFSLAYNNKAISLERLGRLDEAKKCLERAKDFWPDDPLVCGNLAVVKFNNSMKMLGDGKISAAIDEYNSALRIGEKYEDLVQLLNTGNFAFAQYFASKNNWEKAATWCRKALKHAPGDREVKDLIARCLTNAGILHFNKREYGKARAKALESLKFVPDYGPAKELLEAIRQAQKG